MHTRNLQTRRRAGGFTLIELMVVVALIGVLGSIALMSYSQFIQSSESAVLVHNYEQAIDTARNNYVVARQMRSMGLDPVTIVPDDAAGWVAIFNSTEPPAPGGGLAYEVGAGSVSTGAIGIQVNGTYATADLVVTLNRPVYAGMPASSVDIEQADF